MKSPSQVLVLVRHGETAWSRSGQHTGRTDLALLEEGRQMATRLREPLRSWNFAAVWTSPLRRASETCELAGYGNAAQLRADLMEWDYGTFEGKTKDEIRATSPNWTLWTDGVPCGESARDVGARADRVIADARSVPGNVLIFSHGHMLRVLTARWLGLPPTEGRLFLLNTAALCVLGFDGDGDQPIVQLWNDTCHLRG
ncbi:histidine phosphatase family protein [Vitiosangium sp. GDMCC 1.1324]|uniref:histidine phosphatase family protein n=1 Tax=Vitiosangium sp. (strain GDMCC 1.1324) TaxID=2138576 RepID=UPI000D3449D5|nr:histidine phosphatase family protein [Vitiosangium sp. GDMCC 1.1324]PTL84014.1 histidine phosphatase family protein [Vitiosangium sp. GDMCC 1.1324]